MVDHDKETVSQLMQHLRFYGDMRFKQLTLFMAAMTAVSSGVLQYPQNRWWIALAGLCITSVMWVMETRSTLYALAAHNAIPADLLPRPNVKCFRWLGASLVVLLLHLGFYSFWLVCIRIWCPTCISFCIGLIVGIGLLSYSTVNYWFGRKFWLGS